MAAEEKLAWDKLLWQCTFHNWQSCEDFLFCAVISNLCCYLVVNLCGYETFSGLTSVCFSSESLTHDAKGSQREPSLPWEAGKSTCPSTILPTRENCHLDSFNLGSQKMKKRSGKSVSKSAEKTFQALEGFSLSTLFKTHQIIRFTSV